MKKHQQPTPRSSCMTTVQEELEQPPEEVEDTKDCSTEKSDPLGCSNNDNLTMPDSQTTNSTSINSTTFKERLNNDKNNLNLCSSKESTNVHSYTKLHCSLKTSSCVDNQNLPVTTLSSNSANTLQPAKHSSIHSSYMQVQNPSSVSPTRQTMIATQVATTAVPSNHESGQVCYSISILTSL